MGDYTEQQIFEALGLGAEAQEVAAPAAQQTEAAPAEGAEVQEVAAPAEADMPPNDSTDDIGDDADTSASETGLSKQPQTPEQRRQNAARRRQHEQQLAIDQAVQAALAQEKARHDDEMADLFAQAGLKNTITNEPITNMEQFAAWRRAFDGEHLQRQLKAGRLTPEGLETAIGNHPIVKQAQKLVEQSAADQRNREMEAAKAQIEAEVAEIGKVDKSIKSLEDLVNAPCWKEIHEKTKRGYSLTDAYFAVNRKRLDDARAEEARQQAMNNARGKSHMTPTATPTGTGAVSVPAADMAIFRQFLPGATDAEIQAYYNKYKSK